MPIASLPVYISCMQVSSFALDLTPLDGCLVAACCWRQGPCQACDLAALSLHGSCLPGQYTFLYSATSLDGSSTASEVRTVVVYKSTSVNFQLDVATQYTTSAAAAAAAGSIAGGNATSVGEAVAVVLGALGPTASDVHSSDVRLEGVTSGPHVSGNFSVTVTVTVSFFEPDGVHSWQVQQAAAAWSGRRRHLLASLSGGSTARHADVCEWNLHGSDTCSAAVPPSDAVDNTTTQPAALEGVSKSAAADTLQAEQMARAAHRRVVAAVSGIQGTQGLVVATRGRRLLASNATTAAAAAAAAASSAGASGVSSSQGQPTDEIGVSVRGTAVHHFGPILRRIGVMRRPWCYRCNLM